MSINQYLGNGGRHIVPSVRKSIHHHDRCPFASGEDMGRYGDDNSTDDEQPERADPGVDEVDNVMRYSYYRSMEYLQNGGCHIVPSARKSIHNHDGCAFARGEDMGRYGDNNSPNDQQPEREDPGVDEVDNVMSKLSHSSRPLAMRRSSMTPPNLQYTDDSEEHNPLAKSLPATLPSRSYYSDDFAWRIQNPLSKQLNDPGSVTLQSRGNRSGDSRNSSFATRFPNVSHRLNQTRDEEKKSSGIFVFFIVGLLTVLSAVYFDFFGSLKSQQIKYDEAKFYNVLNELGAKYNIGDDSILRLQTGISTIFKQEDTSCVIFLYNSMRNDFDPSMLDGFVNNVASNAAKFLRNDTTSVEHIVVEGSDLTMVSHTQLVKAYREDVAKTGVLLIRDVEHVPSTLAMAFHYYCDEYNPLVKKSVIFFTLNTAKCHNSGEKSSHASVESCLKRKWDTVPKDNIGPLLTRVVSIVVDVNGV